MLSIATTRTIRTHVCACVARTVVKKGGMARAAGAAAGCLLSIAAMALLLSLALSGSGDDANTEGEGIEMVAHSHARMMHNLYKHKHTKY